VDASVAGGQAGSSGAAPSTDGGLPELTGTWEIIGSRIGKPPASAIVTISPTVLTVNAAGGGFLSAVAHGNVFDVDFNANVPSVSFTPISMFAAERTALGGDTGIIPLPLFGDWNMHSGNTPGCTVKLEATAAAATCTHVIRLPDWAIRLNGTLQATREMTLPSAFGDFGGVWHLTTDTGADCTLRFEASTVSSSCTKAKKANGTASFTLDGDTGHGTTSAGIEFTAQRR
jgi:hypothetical protein